jgi:hypothetical protein
VSGPVFGGRYRGPRQCCQHDEGDGVGAASAVLKVAMGFSCSRVSVVLACAGDRGQGTYQSRPPDRAEVGLNAPNMVACDGCSALARNLQKIRCRR